MRKDSVNVDQVKVGDVIAEPIRQRSRVLERLTPISSEEDRGYAFVSCRRMQFRSNVTTGLGIRAGNLHFNTARQQSVAKRNERVARPAVLRRKSRNDVQDFQVKLFAPRAI